MVFYSDGLSFECTRCGVCCRQPGYIYLEQGESRPIAEFLKISLQRFLADYTCRDPQGFLSIKFLPDDERCLFWDDQKGCAIYPVRPIQCRTFPFWPENLTHRSAWEALKEYCPGVDRGRLYSQEEVEKRADARPGDF